jgi:hypothetical protein
MKKLSAILGLFFAGFFLFATERLIVNNIEINDFKNPTDILGDGTTVFDPASATLTLNKATLTKGASDKGLEYAEFPAILFEGNLTIVLKGKNIISVGSDSLVMGEKLHNNAIVGSGTLIISGEKNASLEMNGMVNAPEYIQKSGNVIIAIENNHSKITKWGLYCDNKIEISSGTLSICMTGKNPGGALMMDKNGDLTYAQGAALYEGNSEPGSLVKALTWSKGLSKETKRFVKIILN